MEAISSPLENLLSVVDVVITDPGVVTWIYGNHSRLGLILESFVLKTEHRWFVANRCPSSYDQLKITLDHIYDLAQQTQWTGHGLILIIPRFFPNTNLLYDYLDGLGCGRAAVSPQPQIVVLAYYPPSLVLPDQSNTCISTLSLERWRVYRVTPKKMFTIDIAWLFVQQSGLLSSAALC